MEAGWDGIISVGRPGFKKPEASQFERYSVAEAINSARVDAWKVSLSSAIW